MKFKIVHPLWVHLPAILAIAAAVFFTVRALPLPDNVPTHFDLQGNPNGYGSLWTNNALLLVMALFFLGFSVWLDELWARQEKVKRFNWISLFDDLALAGLCGIQIGYVNMLASQKYVFPFPWLEVGLSCGLVLGAAVILELLRPYRPGQAILKTGDSGQVDFEVNKLVESGQALAYWESQNPAYVGGLSIVIPLIMFASAFMTWASLPWLSVLMVLFGLGMFTMYGGFRTLVTRETVTVKMGIFGFKLLQLKVTDIAEASVHKFEPLRDFGGYGIRFNQEMQAYYLRGDTGVKVIARSGKKYLIGSDQPGHLAAVITAVAGLTHG